MKFFQSLFYLDTVKVNAPYTLVRLANELKYRKQEFINAIDNRNSDIADEIIEYNIQRLTNTSNVRIAMANIANKFPELDINLSNAQTCFSMACLIGSRADEILRIAERSH